MTAAAGLDSASKLVCFLHKSGRGTSAKVGVTRNFELFAGELHPLSVTQDRFYSVDHLGQALLSVVRNWEMSAIQVFLLYINHSEFSCSVRY